MQYLPNYKYKKNAFLLCVVGFIMCWPRTDLTVAITAMTFYTTDNILGYWPFGEFLCGVWIFNDYGMTFAS
jgi:1,4-dihydroxy-2-naphthoate octaprenyltransferase